MGRWTTKARDATSKLWWGAFTRLTSQAYMTTPFPPLQPTKRAVPHT